MGVPKTPIPKVKLLGPGDPAAAAKIIPRIIHTIKPVRHGSKELDRLKRLSNEKLIARVSLDRRRDASLRSA
jgi:hypothetical protein